MLSEIVFIIFPIVAIVTSGYLYAKRFQTDMEVANRLNLNIFLPALLFSVFTSKEFNLLDFQFLALGGIAVILIY